MTNPGTGVRDPAGAWYRQPVVWLGAVLLAASLAGCVWMIVLATRYADEPLPTAGGQVFKVPRAHPQPAAANPVTPTPPASREVPQP
ncbi:hypothetical protein [Dokdonella sp.]|uniref:hypothetical protein n=1 Tax=Dokdonella sp. TaxID=2291710 RepID=UPI0031CB4B5E|nr:hypothetical protein [Dokdonella sp.]